MAQDGHYRIEGCGGAGREEVPRAGAAFRSFPGLARMGRIRSPEARWPLLRVAFAQAAGLALGLLLAATLHPEVQAQLALTEFQASNVKTLQDEDGDNEDWVEICNRGEAAVDLAGWHLTDEVANLRKWQFPSTNLGPGEFLVVFASNKDHRVPGRPLHTNFKLSDTGEYLALVAPDGLTIATRYSPQYPVQAADASYGLPVVAEAQSLLSPGALGKFLVPRDDSLSTNWIDASFDDAAWLAITNGVGFGFTGISTLTNALRSDVSSAMAGANASAYLRFPFRVEHLNELDQLQLRVRYNDGFLAYLNGRLVATRNAPVESPGGVQADSISDWSAAGQQGFNNWYYGSYNRGADPDASYDPFTDFHPNLDQWTWNGGAWVLGPSNPPWDMISAGGWQPNGTNSGGVHWVIRRWICEATGPARCQIAFAKDNVTCGSGATLRVFQNGLQRFTYTLRYNDPAGTTTNLFLPDLQAGDLLDFALDPLGTDGSASDSCDSCTFETIIEQSPSPGAVWNSAATSARSREESATIQEISLTAVKDLLLPGTNVLALQGLNTSAADPTFLLIPEIVGTYLRLETNRQVYFTQPTPRAPNGPGSTNLGPILSEVQHLPQIPRDADDLTVSARVTPTLRPVASVTMKYRVMYGAEATVAMHDDGLQGDETAGDSYYAARIPASASKVGQMVRYYLSATDTLGQATRSPAYASTTSSPQYHGTVVWDPALTNSRLPVLHWFIANPSTADSDTTARCSLFFDGEFYDNTGANLHGQSTRGFPKKSYDLDFNPGYTFRWSKDAPRVDDLNLLTTWADKSHMRHVLAYDTYRDAGAPHHFAFPVRVQRNGAFYSVANLVENGDENQLQRLGLDPKGAYYKMYNLAESTSGAEKKTRKKEGTADLQALITGMSQSSASAREAYLYDNLNLPEVIDFLAAKIITADVDCCHKNYYLYRDTEGTGEWQMMPWDVDLSFGRVWTCGATCLAYFDETIYTDQSLFVGYGNRVITPVYDTAATRQMFLRRLRTLMDSLLQPPGTPAKSDFYRLKTQALRDQIAPDAALDLAAWGTWGTRETITQAVNRVWNEFLPGRRAYMFQTLSVTNRGEIPLPQPTNAVIQFGALEYRAVSGNPLQEWLSLTNGNSYSVDVSGWRLEGGVRLTFKPGTVIPARSTLYVSPNTRAFRARTISPKGGERRFVVGPYEGNLSAWGESLTLSDATGRVVSARSFSGTPSEVQRFLRVTELFYHPDTFPTVQGWDQEQFEFIELRNIGPASLSLAGVKLTEGVLFDFSTAGITNLASGDRVILARNTNAFHARYGTTLPLAGQYLGSLENAGERLRLEDAFGEKILDFSYNNAWYPITDGHGFSLVIVDDAAPWDSWGLRTSWRPNGQRNGTPGQSDPQLPSLTPVVINELLAHTDLPQVDSIELHNPTDQTVQVGGWWLSDDFATPKKFRIPAPTPIGARGYVNFAETQFNPGVGTSFGLNSEGDELWLFSADPDGNLTGYAQGLDFGASANGVSFGRFTNSLGEIDYPAQATLTLGKDNGRPIVGPIVVSEIMYHPPSSADPNSSFSYIELANFSGTNAPLYQPAEPTNTWRLRNAIDFDFPEGVLIPPHGHLLIVGFDPTTNTMALTAFQTLYGLSKQTPVFGPWQGKLGNGDETLELKRPDFSGSNGVPYVLVERVRYSDQAPWPVTADGQGASLQRRDLAGYANEPTNWFAAPPTTGAPNVPNHTPEVLLTSPVAGSVFNNPTNILFQATAVDPDGQIQRLDFLADGQKLTGVSTAPYSFTWTNPPPGVHEVAAVAIDNRLGTATSPTVTITVLSQPPKVQLLTPTQGTMRMAGTSLDLLASAEDPDGQMDRVTFLAGTQILGEVFAPPYSINWTPAVPGVYALSALATDNSGSVSTSSVVQVAFTPGTQVDVTLVSTGSVWRFLDDGSNQGTAWRGANFSDSGWKRGPAELGYGDRNDGRPEATLISYGTDSAKKHITYYFRLAFNLSNAASFENLSANLLRDDGAMVYLNDQLVFRSNLAEGANHLTTAEYAVSGAEESTFFSQAINPVHLREGVNLVAVEVHQSAADSSDLSFDLSLTGKQVLLAPALFEGPQSRTFSQGDVISLSVTAGGTGPLSYLWQFDGRPIPGVTGSVYTITNATASFAGTYRVIVSNSVGQTLSEPCVLELAGQPPIAGVDGLLALGGTVTSVPLSSLLANDSNPDGATLAINAVDPISEAGAKVALSGKEITYLPLGSFLGNDTFRYQLSDSHGHSATGRVELLVYDGTLPQLHQLTVAPSSGGYRLRYQGTPGRLCEIQRSRTLTNWTRLQAAPLPAHGYLDYVESNPPSEGAFYRVIEP